jgi:DNA replication protein DnaC
LVASGKFATKASPSFSDTLGTSPTFPTSVTRLTPYFITVKIWLQGFKVLYFNTQKLFTRLRMSKADGSYMREINRIEKMDVLILDDFGLQQMDDQNRMAFLEIIEDRHGLKSTIISSQLPVSLWHDVIGEGSVADAILDRLVNGAHRMDLMGDSLRKIK